jgi:hypothetical protein
MSTDARITNTTVYRKVSRADRPFFCASGARLLLEHSVLAAGLFERLRVWLMRVLDAAPAGTRSVA